MITISTDVIDTQALLTAVSGPDCGAAVLFVGMTREWTGDDQTEKLSYETYDAMARAKMQSLLDMAHDRWQLGRIAMQHRTGEVGIGQASVAIAVSSPHRVAAFDAARFLIDTLKTDVPIWKKEFFVGQQTRWQENQDS
jgi:molybdopterin synthase catalytic subunit